MVIDQDLKLELKKYLDEEIKKDKRQEVVILTPYKLADSEMQQFYRYFPNLLKGVSVKNIIDKDILGGFIIRVKTTVFDASVKGKINRLAAEILSS